MCKIKFLVAIEVEVDTSSDVYTSFTGYVHDDKVVLFPVHQTMYGINEIPVSDFKIRKIKRKEVK